MFVPSDGIYQAALRTRADRVRRRPAGPDGHADHPDRAPAGGPLRLAAGADRRVRTRDRRVRTELHAAGPLRRAARQVGRQLDSAVGAYNEAVGSFDHRVVPQLRRIEQAGASSDREMPPPRTVESQRAAVQARWDSQPRAAGVPEAAGARAEARDRTNRWRPAGYEALASARAARPERRAARRISSVSAAGTCRQLIDEEEQQVEPSPGAVSLAAPS